MAPHNLFILGAPRSGTSMTAGVLSDAGYWQGDDFEPTNERNPHGFFESRSVNFINEEMLKPIVRRLPMALWHFLEARKWESLARPVFPMFTPYGKRFLSHIRANAVVPQPSADVQANMRALVARKPFCLKDPRFSYTLNRWRELAPESRAICVLRDPYVTAQSMIDYGWPFTRANALKTWACIYEYILSNYDIEREDWRFVHYEQILEGEIWNALQAFTGATLKRDFVDRKANRSRPSPGPRDARVDALYARLCELAEFCPASR